MVFQKGPTVSIFMSKQIAKHPTLRALEAISILTDINMPGLDGHDVISALRVMHDDVPIIAISGGSAVGKEELLLQASRLGASEVITKPFEFEQLAGAVSRALGLWRTS